MAFTEKFLSFVFDLGEGTFGNTGANRLRLDGLRASATIVAGGVGAMGHADLAIYGMSRSNMSTLSTLGMRLKFQKRNRVTVEAGDAQNGMSTVFQGLIVDGWADLSAMPQTLFRIEAYAGAIEALQPIPPSTFNGFVDVATIMAGLAQQAGLKFINHGVDRKLWFPYFPGTVREQMRACADHADINWMIELDRLEIWPKGEPRGAMVPLVSARTGMIGYPSFAAVGIQVAVLYNPSIGLGTRIKVESDIAEATGFWDIGSLVHSLEANTLGGQWTTRLVGVMPGYVALAPSPGR